MIIILTQKLIASTIEHYQKTVCAYLQLHGGTLAMTELQLSQKQHMYLISLLENLNLDLK